jgi:hypothetical protein
MIITTVARIQSLSYLLAKDTTVKTLTLRLFSNNITVTETTKETELTELTLTNGYSAKALTGSSWSASVTGSSFTYPTVTWTFTGPNGNVYGYYVTNSAGSLILAEKFPSGPYNVQNNGDIINVNLTLQMV